MPLRLRKLLTTSRRLLPRILLVVLAAIAAIFISRAFEARNLAEPGVEHRLRFSAEFSARQESRTDWSSYVAVEQALIEELRATIDPASRGTSLVDRYATHSVTNPERYAANWNLSYEMTALSPVGAAVMLHGLTDSPYSMLATAQAAVGAGYNVTVPRMPGHGFAVGALLQTRGEDWAAAVRVAVRRADQRRRPGQPLLLVGYSNGGLLAIDYALRCKDDATTPCPDRIVLLSPAISVSPAAALANWHSVLSWLPYFEKFKWFSILPEADPFKFTSFPKRAGQEIHKIVVRTNKALKDPQQAAKLPPILAFVSAVDNTVSSEAVVSVLYSRLPQNGSEVVIYDVNRNSTMVSLMRSEPLDPLPYFSEMSPLNFNVTIVRNRTADSDAVDIATRKAGSDKFAVAETNMRWPQDVFSLSHIAIPFSPMDSLYGDGSNSSSNEISFGTLAPRGEAGVLLLTPSYFLRMRYNPFFLFQVDHMSDWLQSI